MCGIPGACQSLSDLHMNIYTKQAKGSHLTHSSSVILCSDRKLTILSSYNPSENYRPLLRSKDSERRILLSHFLWRYRSAVLGEKNISEGSKVCRNLGLYLLRVVVRIKDAVSKLGAEKN